jgi:hypothetical protein
MRRRRRTAERSRSRPSWGDLLRSPLDLDPDPDPDLRRSPQSSEAGEQATELGGDWGYLRRPSWLQAGVQPGDWGGGAEHALTRRGWSRTV